MGKTAFFFGSIGLLLSVSLLGQTRLDSLRQLVQQSPNDSVHFQNMLQLADAFEQTDSAFFYVYKMQQEARQAGNLLWKGKSHLRLARYFRDKKSDLDSVIFHAQQAHSIFEKSGNTIESGQALNFIGIGYRDKGERTQAIEYLTQAANQLSEAGADSLTIPILINMAAVFVQQGAYEKEEAYLKQAHDMAWVYKDKRNLAISSMGLQSAMKRAHKLDSALYYANFALRISRELNSPMMIAYSYLNLAAVKSDQGNFAQAETYYQQAVDDHRVASFDRARFRYFWGRSALDHGFFAKAEQQLRMAADTAMVLQSKDLEHNAYSYLMEALHEQGKHAQAYDIARKYIILTDSIHTENIRQKVEELTLQYEKDEAERENEGLRVEKAEQELLLVQEQARTRQRTFAVVILGMLILGFGFVFWHYHQNAEQQRQLAAQSTHLQQQRIQQLKDEQQLINFRGMIAGQETERSRLAQELHDSLGSMLSNLKLVVGKEKTDRSTHSVQLIDKASTELRRIAQNMMPETLARFGLITAIEDLVDEVNYTRNIQVNFQHFGESPTLPDYAMLSAYRIVQELLNNIVKHAEATEVLVQLIQHDDHVHLTIEDNGKGFDVDNPGSGHGLRNVHSRVAILNGTIEFDSDIGKGTTVSLMIPTTQLPNELV